jgi:phenylacetic acid degradation operon negative regulatory protein
MINSCTPGSGTPGGPGDGSDALRPLNARSIVLSVLLGSHPPEMPVRRLLEFTSLFGLADGTVRTALSRLVAADELTASDGVYRLSDRLLVRQSEQDTGRTAPTDQWDGTWWFAVITAERRTVAERREFRQRASGARLGELRPDTWLRPANIPITLDQPDVIVTRGPLVRGDGAAIAAQLWDLPGLERRAAVLVDALAGLTEILEPPVPDVELPAAFSTLAACQRFLRVEPQLPAELSPHRSADTLRARYGDVVGRFQSALTDFFARRTPHRAATGDSRRRG